MGKGRPEKETQLIKKGEGLPKSKDRGFLY